MTMDWGNTAIPLNVKKRLGAGLSYQGTLAYSKFDQGSAFSDIMSFDNAVEQWTTRQELIWNPNAAHQLVAGGEFERFNMHFAEAMPVYDFRNENQIEADLYAAYAQHRYVFNPRHTVSYGARGYWYPLLEQAAVDPRATYTWRPGRNWRTDLHAGQYHQFLTSIRPMEQESFNENWYPANGNVGPSKSTLISAGVEKGDWTRLGLRVGLEGYYKHIEDLPLYFPNRTNGEADSADSASGSDQIHRNFATQSGWAAGLELSVKRESGALSGEISYGLSQAVLQRHTAKMQLNIHWRGDKGNALWTARKKGRFLRTGLQANFHTGLPYTDFQDYYPVHEPDQGYDGGNGSGPPPYLNDNLYLRQGRRNAATRKDYFRLDATLLDIGREGKWRLFWTVINLTNRENVFMVNFDTKENPPKRTETPQLPILPIFVGYEYQF
jgi:hypothetical protein